MVTKLSTSKVTKPPRVVMLLGLCSSPTCDIIDCSIRVCEVGFAVFLCLLVDNHLEILAQKSESISLIVK